MPLGAENVQSSDGNDFFVLHVGLLLVSLEGVGPLVGRNRVFVSVVVEDGSLSVFLRTFDLALRYSQLLRNPLLDHFLLGHELRIAAQQNVCTAAGHVRCDGYCAFASCLRDDLRFALVEFGVKHHVLDGFLLQQFGKALGFFDRCGADQYRLALRRQLLDFVRRREILFFLGTVDDICILDTSHLLVRRDDDDFQLVDLVELGGFRFGCTGHTGQLLEHAEVILEGNRSQRLIFALDLDVFLGLDRLMQAVRPAAAWHHASGELVDDDYLTVFDHVFHVAAIERVGLNRGLNVMLCTPVFRIGDVANPKQLFDLLPTHVGHRDVAVLLIDYKVAGEDFSLRIVAHSRKLVDQLVPLLWCNFFGLELLAQFVGTQLLATHQLRDDSVDNVVLVSGFLACARDDERRTGLVNQDRVDFVNDGIVVPALHAIPDVELHVVAEIVEAELVVSPVGNVRCISSAALFIIEVVHDNADCQSQEAIQPSHPFGVALRQVVVDGNNVYAPTAQRVEVYRKGGDQRLTFASLHF